MGSFFTTLKKKKTLRKKSKILVINKQLKKIHNILKTVYR